MTSEMVVTTEDISYLNKTLSHRFQKLMRRHNIDVDDVVQQTLEHALRSWRSFDGLSSFRTWLVSIGRNTLLMECRRRKTRKYDVPNGIDVEHHPSIDHDTENRLAARETLHLCTGKVTTEQLETLMLHHAYGYTREEIVTQLGIAKMTIGTREFYARKTMKNTRLELAL